MYRMTNKEFNVKKTKENTQQINKQKITRRHKTDEKKIRKKNMKSVRKLYQLLH